jgi:hypothetical protein
MRRINEMAGRIYIRPDRETKEGFVCDQYHWEGPGTPEVLDRFCLRFASALELKQELVNAGFARFGVTTAGSDPTVVERDCTPGILINRFLDNGRDRWQSLNIIDKGRQGQHSR